MKLKDIGFRKRVHCKTKLVCVPDSILNRGCTADIYSIGLLMLQFVLGLDLFRMTASEIEAIPCHSREMSADLIDLLVKLFSGQCTFADIC